MSITIDLDDVQDYNPDLAESLVGNTLRYQRIFADAIDELLPEYKERDPTFKDALDVYIEHRLLMEQRLHNDPAEIRDWRNKYPAELMRRYEVILLAMLINYESA